MPSINNIFFPEMAGRIVAKLIGVTFNRAHTSRILATFARMRGRTARCSKPGLWRVGGLAITTAASRAS